MAPRRQLSAVRWTAGPGALLMALAGSAVFAVTTGAVEVFIDATRGAIQKIPIAVYSFNSATPVPGQPAADVLKADLRRSLLFDVADLERLGITAGMNSQPAPEALQKAGEAGLPVQVWGTLLPRGREIVMDGVLFESSRGEVGHKRYDPQIEELDLVTGARRTLVALPGLNITPEWSPSGDELAFATTRDGNSEIYKVDKSGRRFERLTEHGAADLAPTWSPTGRELAFTSDRGGTPQIYLMSADGTNVRALTYPDRHGSYNSSAVWSPKGNWLAYVCRDERQILKICL